MKKVITYGTYDLLHYGHIKLLERAKALGDYLIVGVTSDDFDKTRGKINIQQSLEERIENVKKTGLADLIIVEEYEGQKIDDIKRHNVDIFTVGSDWKGKFDYLNEFCEVRYLQRTEGISSSAIRSEQNKIRLGIVGDSANYLNKFQKEDIFVNGIDIVGICTNNIEEMSDEIKSLEIVTADYGKLISKVDAIYINSNHANRYEQIKIALDLGKHVLCESPVALSRKQFIELKDLAREKKCVLMEAIRTAYSTAYSRLLLLIKAGKIGEVMSIDLACTSMQQQNKDKMHSMLNWGANAVLPIFQILGPNYKTKKIITHYANPKKENDLFTKVEFVYKNSSASMIVAEGAKSEGQMIITGTKGYIIVPAPWWKTDYFEVRYEDQTHNKRYFYQLDGEGIRYELVAFLRTIKDHKDNFYISSEITLSICQLMEDFMNNKDVIEI